MGLLDGVMSTRTAWVDGREVVQVQYRPDLLPFEKLLEHALTKECARHVYTTNDAQLAIARKRIGELAQKLEASPRPAKAADQLHYLARSPYRFLPLTQGQAQRVNSAMALGLDKHQYLSRRQIQLASVVKAVLTKEPAALAELQRPGELELLDEYGALLIEALERAKAE